jgi:hypothetical protein
MSTIVDTPFRHVGWHVPCRRVDYGSGARLSRLAGCRVLAVAPCARLPLERARLPQGGFFSRPNTYPAGTVCSPLKSPLIAPNTFSPHFPQYKSTLPRKARQTTENKRVIEYPVSLGVSLWLDLLRKNAKSGQNPEKFPEFHMAILRNPGPNCVGIGLAAGSAAVGTTKR